MVFPRVINWWGPLRDGELYGLESGGRHDKSGELVHHVQYLISPRKHVVRLEILCSSVVVELDI